MTATLQLNSQETYLLMKVIMKCVNIKLLDLLACFHYIFNASRTMRKLHLRKVICWASVDNGLLRHFCKPIESAIHWFYLLHFGCNHWVQCSMYRTLVPDLQLSDSI